MTFFGTSLDHFFKEIISKKRSGLGYSILLSLLLPLSWIFSLVVRLRRFVYSKGLLSRYLPRPFTICVGNITAGGTGKTPFTIFLAKQLKDSARLAVITRGYKSQAEKTGEVINLSQESAYDTSTIGDEASLLRKSIDNALVIVGKDRKKAIEFAESKGVECILLDDGMQHLQVKPNVQIVLVDAQDPFGGGYLLPRGLLREPKSSLHNADLIVLTRSDCIENIDIVESLVKKYSTCPIIHSVFKIQGLFDALGNNAPIKTNCRLGIFCGIASPDQFKKSLVQQGYEVTCSLFMQDHVGLAPSELARFAEECKKQGAEALVCTEKDLVRLPHNFSSCLPIYYAKGQIEITKGKDVLNTMLEGFKTALCNN